MTTAFILIIALALPLLLIPVEQVWPFPYLIEELVKLGLVFLIFNKGKKIRKPLIWVILAGIVFTLSESVLYLMNFFTLGSMSNFLARLLLTGGLHVGTMVLMYLFAAKSRKWLFLALPLAILVHYFFSLWVAVSF